MLKFLTYICIILHSVSVGSNGYSWVSFYFIFSSLSCARYGLWNQIIHVSWASGSIVGDGSVFIPVFIPASASSFTAVRRRDKMDISWWRLFAWNATVYAVDAILILNEDGHWSVPRTISSRWCVNIDRFGLVIFSNLRINCWLLIRNLFFFFVHTFVTRMDTPFRFFFVLCSNDDWIELNVKRYCSDDNLGQLIRASRVFFPCLFELYMVIWFCNIIRIVSNLSIFHSITSRKEKITSIIYNNNRT
jgi:hypothetical protein